MKKNSLIKKVDRDNLLIMYIFTRKLEMYGRNYRLSQTDIDNLFKIGSGYLGLIERVREYEKSR